MEWSLIFKIDIVSRLALLFSHTSSQPSHNDSHSKEESLIISLQTQLALKTDLCGHYETDLKARDELVEILGKKLADLEKDGTEHKNALRSWKKKVQELERQLEETIEDLKQESMKGDVELEREEETSPESSARECR